MLGMKTIIYTPPGVKSLEDSLCHSNNGLVGKLGIRQLRPWPSVVMAHWPWFFHTFEEDGLYGY